MSRGLAAAGLLSSFIGGAIAYHAYCRLLRENRRKDYMRGYRAGRKYPK